MSRRDGISVVSSGRRRAPRLLAGWRSTGCLLGHRGDANSLALGVRWSRMKALPADDGMREGRW